MSDWVSSVGILQNQKSVNETSIDLSTEKRAIKLYFFSGFGTGVGVKYCFHDLKIENYD
jgi:hypothetical protein